MAFFLHKLPYIKNAIHFLTMAIFPYEKFLIHRRWGWRERWRWRWYQRCALGGSRGSAPTRLHHLAKMHCTLVFSLYYTVLHCTTLHCMHFSALISSIQNKCTARSHWALGGMPVLHCIALNNVRYISLFKSTLDHWEDGAKRDDIIWHFFLFCVFIFCLQFKWAL